MRCHTRYLIETLRRNLKSPTNGAEVGVWKGENACHLLESFQTLHLWMVDNYTAPLTPELMLQRCGPKEWTQIDFDEARKTAMQVTQPFTERRTLLAMDSCKASQCFTKHYLDFVFIDASHDYDSVRADLVAWTPKVRVGGVIAGHDYGGRGDRVGRFGVKRAVDERFTNVRTPGSLVWYVVKEEE